LRLDFHALPTGFTGELISAFTLIV